ncbi:MAG: VOC family protein [Acidobacteriota bacterium]
MRKALTAVDHLVYAAPDLEAAVVELQGLLGVRAAAGGRHPGEGTRNALISLGGDAYLEILGPDPDQPSPGKQRWFGIDILKAARLVGWAAKTEDLEGVARQALETGIPLGPVTAGRRQRSDRVALSWQFSDPHVVLGDGLVPFFIDWKDSPHPARAAPRGVSLVELRAEHPEPGPVQAMLAGLGLDLPVKTGPKPALIASLRTPRGLVELR